jgi:integrase
MKMKEEHIVPLVPQVIEILGSLQDISGKRQYLFPGYHDLRNFMSENAMVFAIRKRLNFDATAHGFRTVASTVLNEQGFRADIIERQLAHTERNKIRAAYNRAQYIQERREMMVWWADYLQSLLIKYRARKN